MSILRPILVSTFFIALASSCGLFDGEPLIEPNDPCAEVHEVYPDVEVRNCSYVAELMRNYRPPEFMPPATDTGGPLMAARILTDTGEVLFVAQGVPGRFLRPSCPDGGGGVIQSGHFVVSGQYCERPPVDTRDITLKFFLDSVLHIYQEPDRFRTRFTIITDTDRADYELTQLENFTKLSTIQNSSLRILSGQFEAILHNRRDPTDSIRLVDGRFDMRY